MSVGINYEEDLVSRIRDLIDGYSKSSILKEYLQNADDSGATELVVTFDKRIHNSLNDTKFEAAKEASLILYNNASFKEKDFKAIVKISAQAKIEEAGSTGRFGQGFSSSFSVSDHPSFVSSGKAYWFDVLKTAVSKDQDMSIQAWDLEKDTADVIDWLETFNIDSEQSGTFFRLPLRSAKTASNSEISHEIFKYDDFLTWCDEWKRSTSGLLFLRHIQKLVLQEINENNETIKHVEIQTINFGEVTKYNNEIQTEFSHSLQDICKNWKNTSRDLPRFAYKHHFSIKSIDLESSKSQEREESWAVVNGLFRGENDRLIDQAIEVLKISPNPRKVLPWAGVAISIDAQGRVLSNNSNYYSFLPLPIKSKHSVHIHGWFDLNPKRTEITHEGSGDDKDILIEWNRLLFEDGIGVAWAHLIDFIKNDCDHRKYYSLWPRDNEDDFDTQILEGFYREIINLECLKTRYKNNEARWNKPSDEIYYLQSGDNLFEPFKNHFSIITPRPSIHIINGLSGVGTDLEALTPDFIRDYLIEECEDLDFPFSIEASPITMLSKIKWILSIFKFCAEAEDNGDFQLIESLPMELDVENHIRIPEHNRIVDVSPKLAIFENDSSLFINRDIVEIVKDATRLPSSWLKPCLKNYMTLLQENIEGYNRKNKRWLNALIKMLEKADETDFIDALDEIHSIEALYLIDGDFSVFESDATSPFLIPKEEVSNIPLLEKTGMSIVHPDYIEIYRPLLQLDKFNLLKRLDSYSLITYLINIPSDEYAFFNEYNIREYLVELLAKDISWIDALSDNEKAWLNAMPFIATESGNIYSISDDSRLYLSEGFSPPESIENLHGEYEIIIAADSNQRSMFKALGFQKQTPINYLTQIIIPFIEDEPDADDVINIIKWLSLNWDELIKDISETEVGSLIGTLSNSAIVMDESYNLNCANKYYHPDFFHDLPDVLKDRNYLPYTFDDKNTTEKWHGFLHILGASTKLFPEHVVTTVESIAAKESTSSSIEMIKYISNNFELFESMPYGGVYIFDHLSNTPWIPVDRPTYNFLTPENEYKALRKPKEVILAKDYMIAGGVHYFLTKKIRLGKKDDSGDYTEIEVAKKLGILLKLPIGSIFNSFRCLRKNLNNSNEKRILEAAKLFYQYLGRVSTISEHDVPKDILSSSVFINGHWVSSNKVFQQYISLTGIFSWDNLIAKDGQDSELARGLIKLGVKTSPGIEFLVDYLCDLPRNIKLNKTQLKDAKSILIEFQGTLDDIERDIYFDNIPLLSRKDKLISRKELYIKNLPAYDLSANKNDEVEFCQQQFNQIASFCNVLSLGDNRVPKLDYDSSTESDTEDDTWNNYLRSDPLRSAVLRLIYHEGKVSDDEIDPNYIVTILPSEIRLMDTLVVKYFINDVWLYDDINKPAFHDRANRTLYLLNTDDDEDMSENIAKFIDDSAKLNRDSFTLINRILRNKFQSFEKVHDLLDMKGIKSLPEEVNFEEGLSLFDDQSSDQDDSEYIEPADHADPALVSEEPSVENSSIADEINELDRQVDSDQKGISPSGKDIPPPIQPKKTGDSHGGKKKHALNQTDRSSANIDTTNKNDKGSKHSSHHESDSSNSNSNSNSNSSSSSSSSSNSNSNSNSDTRIVSPNNRKPVYVGKEREVDSDNNDRQREVATEIGDKGEDYVLSIANNYLLNSSNRFEKAPKNNEGFDIFEKDSSGEVVRYIEVKTLTGVWGEGGVSLTAPQLEYAQVFDDWWLFVVENINTNNTIIHTFENPVLQANRFIFDHSWKQLAEPSKHNELVKPEKGDRYLLLNSIYEVLSIKSMGKFFKVSLKDTQSEKEVIKKFDPSWEKC